MTDRAPGDAVPEAGSATGVTYSAAGVDIEAGEAAVERIKSIVRSTYRDEVVGDIGGFGGLFDISGLFDTGDAAVDRPMLVSATDGVGTKAMVAAAAQRYDTIGIDLVAMCVDDLVCGGAEPLFFLDYVSVGKLDPAQMELLVGGVAEGCRQAGCALIGGEMAEHPGAMAPGEFDLVGFAVGAVRASQLIDGSKVSPGDVLVGLASPGLRSNGYSLARHLYFSVAGRSLRDPAWAGSESTVADELLRPSVIYAPAILALRDRCEVRAVAHITGGGIGGNLNRVLNATVDAVVDRSGWEPPKIFQELAAIGSVSDAEMAKVFNMGIGMIVVVPSHQVHDAVALLDDRGHGPRVVGEIVGGGTGEVRFS